MRNALDMIVVFGSLIPLTLSPTRPFLSGLHHLSTPHPDSSDIPIITRPHPLLERSLPISSQHIHLSFADCLTIRAGYALAIAIATSDSVIPHVYTSALDPERIKLLPHLEIAYRVLQSTQFGSA
jgi:hypothetical protein